MFFKGFAPIMVVLSLAAAHRHHHHHPPFPPPHRGERMVELQQKVDNMATDVKNLFKTVKDGQLLEMTYDMWTKQKNMIEKLDTLVAMRTKAGEKKTMKVDKMVEAPTAIAKDKVKVKDKVKENATKTDKAKLVNKTRVNMAQPPRNDLLSSVLELNGGRKIN